VNGANIWPGLALGFLAYTAQIIIGLILGRALPYKDRLHIAFAQQNGITAIILALLFETYYPGTAAIVAPAIIAINILHAVANTILDMKLAHDYRGLTPRYHFERLRSHVRQI
jgi:hypothetical protein